jgi:hypothetical protein
VGGTSTRMMPTSQESPITTEEKIVIRVREMQFKIKIKIKKYKKRKNKIFFLLVGKS